LNISRLKKTVLNKPGWQTKKKIIVIESDDWGSIAVRSKKELDRLESKGVPIPDNPFARLDCLESNSDLDRLFDTLQEFKDINGNPPCITTCSLMGNPDFKKIEEANYEKYFYESFDETYKKYPDHDHSLRLIGQGIDNGFVYPQFHGREHLNPKEWIKILQTGDKNELELFKSQSLIGLIEGKKSRRVNGYFAAFDYESEWELNEFNKIIKEGQSIFESKFGFKSKSFVAPTGLRSDLMDQALLDNGIIYHQLGQQLIPPIDSKNTMRHRFFGTKNKLGQIYWRRNCLFEPSRDKNKDWVRQGIQDMEAAFKASKPLVISSHRVNYVGGIDESNRTHGLKNLRKLISKILEIHPDVEFMNSEELGDEIVNTPSYFFGLRLAEFHYDQKI
jgi:hypothetical protein